ncbi:MAG: cation transporter [Pseudobutyrivibrio sp.]|nr:cation transporter [Pseudobutyrivibrio sp.]
MYKTMLKIDGMMCGMCEAHVNDVIRKKVPEAKKVKSSYTKGEASFISEEIPDENMLVAAVGETGYSVEWMKSEPYEKKFLGLF